MPRINLNPYKAIVFVNTFVIEDNMREFIKDKVLSNNRHVVWNYMPSVINRNKFNTEFVRDITGLDLEMFQLKATPKIISAPQTEHKAELSIWTPVPVLVPKNGNMNIIGKSTKNNLLGLVSKQMSNYTSWF